MKHCCCQDMARGNKGKDGKKGLLLLKKRSGETQIAAHRGERA